MRTLGIDLSADPKKTAACSIDWATHEVQFLHRPATDDQLVEAMAAADMTGIDVPLGWPDAFIEALTAHHYGSDWPPVAGTPPLDREPLRYRQTDLDVRAGGAQPLSVSTDRLGVAAMRGARIQHLAEQRGVSVDRSGTTGRVVEAYPAAALRAWGLTSRGYKGTKNAATLTPLINGFAERCGPLEAPIRDVLVGADDDEFDAVVCAFVARAAARGLTAPPDQDQMPGARREGWIHVPAAEIREVAR